MMKYCRVCLKENDNRIIFIDLMEIPNPPVYIRNGIVARSYLECYHFCLQTKRTISNIVLTDYPYICEICNEQMMKTIEFILQSQKNEEFLLSTYDLFKDDSSISEDVGDDLLEDLGSIHSDGEQSVMDVIEDAVETDILDDNLLENNIVRISAHTQINNIDNYVEDCEDKIDNSNMWPSENAIVINVEKTNARQLGNSNDVEDLGQSDNSSIKENSVKTDNFEIDSTKWKTVPREVFHVDFKCLLCRTNFSTQRQLYEHYDNEHDQSTLTFPCDICNRRHISQKALNFHKHSIHNNIEHEDCNLCGQAILPAFMKAHKDRHKNAVLYSCSKCDRTFDRLCTIKQHHRAIHEKDKLRRYECANCDRHFFSEEKLQTHSRVHDDNTNVSAVDYLCHICSKTFPKKMDLHLHLQVHKGNTIKCPRCSKEFVRPKDMEYHIRTHYPKDYPFTCQICLRGFAVRWSYDAHLKQHDGIRHKCKVCDKEYVHLSALRVHSYEHRGYPLTCKICGKGYGVRKKLRIHLKNAHFKTHADQNYSDSMLDEYIVRNKIPHFYLEEQSADDDSDVKDDS
ncbi:uncharacterized protein LOC142230035 [Haematobia irritans]|uniref:uncharacterized protein LOC142230035 n=1 Tax=Haematobia irritans TaxID=7368 RepID=UPI003F506C84